MKEAGLGMVPMPGGVGGGTTPSLMLASPGYPGVSRSTLDPLGYLEDTIANIKTPRCVMKQIQTRALELTIPATRISPMHLQVLRGPQHFLSFGPELVFNGGGSLHYSPLQGPRDTPGVGANPRNLWVPWRVARGTPG
jgi:hypothetical protein